MWNKEDDAYLERPPGVNLKVGLEDYSHFLVITYSWFYFYFTA